jgi:hypothetical protein
MTLLFYTLLIFGISYVLGHAKISLGPREWIARRQGKLWHWLLDLIECPACLSWWLGLAASFAWPSLPPVQPACLTLPFFSAATSFLLGRVTGLTHLPPQED